MKKVFTTSSFKAWMGIFILFIILEVVLRLNYFGVDSLLRFWHFSDRDFTYSSILKEHPNPRLLWVMRENETTYLKGKLFKTNILGARDSTFSLDRWNSSLRYVVLGRSISAGVGVSEEETWPKVFERNLKKLKKAEVLNFSVPAYSYWQLAELYAEKIEKLQPQVVILPIYLGDFYSPVLEYPTRIPLTFIERLQTLEGIVGMFFASSFLRDAVRKIYSLIGNEDWKYHSYPIKIRGKKLEKGAMIYLELIKKLRAQGVRVILMEMPLKLSPTFLEIANNTRKKIVNFSNENDGIDFISAFSVYDNFKLSELYVYPGENHPRAAVHQAIADKFLEEYLKL